MKTHLLRAVLLTLPVLLIAGCAKPQKTATLSLPHLVELAPVTWSNTPVPVRVTGVLSRRHEAELSFKIRGVLEMILVRAGDTVTQGQLLARLRPDEIDAQVAQAHAALAKAQRDLARVEKLQSNRVATFENLQDARTSVELAAAQLRIAEFNQRFAVITAPADGRILRRTAEPGEIVDGGRTVVEFAADADGWLARVGLTDRDAARIHVGDKARLQLGDSPTAVCEGQVSHISAAADLATRTTPAEISVPSAPADARSGVVIAATLFPQNVAARPVVPASALVEGVGNTAGLFVVENGAMVARRRSVQIEAIDGAQVYLRSALAPTDRIVVRGGEFLFEGAPIEEAR